MKRTLASHGILLNIVWMPTEHSTIVYIWQKGEIPLRPEIIHLLDHEDVLAWKHFQR